VNAIEHFGDHKRHGRVLCCRSRSGLLPLF